MKGSLVVRQWAGAVAVRRELGTEMQYLTVKESVRRLRQAGLAAGPRTLLEWIRQERVRDVWVLGRHTYIFEGEVEAIISRSYPP